MNTTETMEHIEINNLNKMIVDKENLDKIQDTAEKISLKNFWYVIAESSELKKNNVLARKVLNEPLVLFREKSGHPVVLPDRCLHRSMPLSCGKVQKGRLICPYHGWVYDEKGEVVDMPAEGGVCRREKKLKTTSYLCTETQGYIYVCLEKNRFTPLKPFYLSYCEKKGFKSLRFRHQFKNTVVNCVENFINVPHTAYVHPGIFRSPKAEEIDADIYQNQGEVHIDYHNEIKNLGSFSWFMNPRRKEIKHRDSFYMPNVTEVHYQLDFNWHYIITSQSVPITAEETDVYTDISFYFGVFTPLLSPLIKLQAKRVIDQDIKVLNAQLSNIKNFNREVNSTFSYGPTDKIHLMIQKIYQELEQGRDPRELPTFRESIRFWV